MLEKIYAELVLIRKQLQAIRDCLELFSEIRINGREMAQSVQKAMHDNDEE